MVAAAAGEPAWVTGDGKSSITELIDNQINTDRAAAAPRITR